MLTDDDLQAIRDGYDAYLDKCAGRPMNAESRLRCAAFVLGSPGHIAALLAEVDRLRAEQRRGWIINDAFLHLALEGSDES